MSGKLSICIKNNRLLLIQPIKYNGDSYCQTCVVMFVLDVRK